MNKILFLALAALCALSARAECRVPFFGALSSKPYAANAVAAAKLNGDSRPDAVLVTGTTVAVALNDGTGTLLDPATVYSGTVKGNVLLQDFDGNGTIDLAFPAADGLRVLPGSGNGTFGTAVTTALALTTPRIAAGRFNQGNTIDVAAIDQAAPLLLFLSNGGNGSLQETSRIALRANPLALTAADFDADGSTDVLVSYSSGGVYDLFYGHGDGTFEARAVQGLTSAISLRGADLNRDGLLEIVAATGGVNITLFRNLGSRTFGDPLPYRSSGSAQWFDVGELTDDELPDVFTAPRYDCSFESWVSSGIVTFSSVWRFSNRPQCYNAAPAGVPAIADFDGDGRNDVLTSTLDYSVPLSTVDVHRNLCGDSQLLVAAEAPVISVGQSVKLAVEVRAPAGQQGHVPGTGTVTLLEGEAVRATATLANGRASLSAGGLAAGEHTFTVAYEGDDQYEPKTSPPVTVRVTAETTTTTIEITPAHGIYGISPRIEVTVTSSDGTTPAGPIRIGLNEYPNYQQLYAPTGIIHGPSDLGTDTYTAAYAGDATHPPSSSTVQYVISKQTPRLVMDPTSAIAGEPLDVLVQVAFNGYSHPGPQGNVTLTAGDFVATQPLETYSSYLWFALPAMTAGRHYLKLSYSGDDHFTAAETLVPFIVFSPSDEAIDARGTAEAVVVTWQAPASLRIVRRKLPSEQWGYWSGGMCCSPPPWIDTVALPETVYQYRMEADGGTAWSSTDIGMRISFLEETLTPRTRIKAVHMQELVRGTNIVRTAAGLAPLSLNITKGMPIAAAHITALREAIQQARVALGATPFPFTGEIASGTLIRGLHVQELREAIR